MSIIECFPMRKRRSVDKTPGRSPCEAPGKLRRTPRRHVNNNHTFHDQSLDIIWDNNSPSPGRTLSLGKRKKHGSDSSSSGGEISDLVQKLADKSGNTPEENPSLLAFWMARDNCAAVQARNTNAVKDNEINKEKHNYKVFQTPSRRPRRVLRKCNKAKIKLLKQEIELLAHRIEEPENEASTDEETVRELISEKIESRSASENTSRIDVDNTNTATKTNQGSENSGTDCVESYSTDFFEGWDNDDEDLILSQVNISNLCNIDEEEPQVMTNTQYLDSGKSPNRNCTVPQPPPPKHHTSSTDVNTSESIVTESWDFVDEFDDNCDESMLQSALEDFERSQSVVIPTVRRLSHLAAPMFQMENKALSGPLTVENSLDKNLCSTGKSKGNQSSMPRHTLSKGLDKANFSFVPHSTLRNATALKSENPQEQQQKDYNSVARNTRIPLKTSIQNNRKTITAVKEEKRIQSKVGEVKDLPKASNESRHKSTEHGHSLTRQVKYSKEDIERKKVEAQHRRRQKMTLSQQKIS